MMKHRCGLVLAGLLWPWVGTALGAPDYWDPRLNDICGLMLVDVASQVPAGQGYWRLVEARFENEQESGGNHVIFYKCLAANGNPIEGQRFFKSWPYANTSINQSQCVGDNWVCDVTKGALDQYWGNSPLWGGCPSDGCNWAYNAFVSEQFAAPGYGYVGLSDKVVGMGMTNPQGTPCNAHVNFKLIWRWTIKAAPAPQICFSPSSFSHVITQGQALASDTLSVWNCGGGTLQYTITDNASWLDEVPASGTSTGETDTILVNYTTSGLGVGTYQATITISDPAASNSPRTVPVTLVVERLNVPGDLDGDSDVDQDDFGLFQRCLSGPGNDQTAQECAGAKLDGDSDVDYEDVVLFQGCMSGAGIAGNPNCLGS